jgi:hypothetical protein
VTRMEGDRGEIVNETDKEVDIMLRFRREE